jgi:hypothetical protein
MKEGLDRHEAVHAIGSVLSGQLFAAMSAEEGESNFTADCLNKLKPLTAESWMKQAS